MTERFYISGVGISDRERKRLYDLQTVDGFISVRDLLNELNDENEQLKKDKTNLHRAMSRDRVKYNLFKDKVFCCIDMKIKLLKDCFMTNEARILEDLKKEIGDDRNE